MIKRKGMFLLLFSLAMGVAAAWVANNWLQMRVMPSANASVGQTQVVTAALKIPYGTKVEAQHVKVINMPDGAAPEGSYRTTTEVEGNVAAQTVLPGEILIKERFADHLGGSTLSALVGQNMRALSVRVDDVVGVAGFLCRATMWTSSRAAECRSTPSPKRSCRRSRSLPWIRRRHGQERSHHRARRDPRGHAGTGGKDREGCTGGKIQLTLRNPTDERVNEEPPPVEVKVAAAPPASAGGARDHDRARY
jgi:pilus assembly protein CpaB